MRLLTGTLVAVLVMLPRTGLAQTSAGATPTSRIFVDVNLLGGTNSLASERTFTSLVAKFSEVATSTSTYPSPSHADVFPLVELGGGVMLLPALGVGVTYGRTTHEDVADLGATIPHPIFLRASASATGVTDARLERRESATHLSAVWVPVRRTRTEVRFFGGPSFFQYDADMVAEILYTQAFDPAKPQSSVTVDGVTTREATGNGAGFHAGGDVIYFLRPAFGIAAGARVSYGTVTVDHEPLSGLSQNIRVGSTVGFVGVRFRFG
jgi:hypothetical protein